MAYEFVRSSNQALTCAANSVFDLQGNDFTLAFSFTCPNVSPGSTVTQTLISVISGTGAATNGFAIYIEQATLYFAPFINSGTQAFLLTRTVASNTRYNIVVTRSGTSFVMYANNAQSNIAASSLSFATGRQLALGLWTGIAARNFTGTMADVAVWNSAALDTNEIASFTAGFTPDQIRPQSLQFYAPLVRDLVDVRGGRTITNVNSATVATHPRIIT